jgi:DNA invertase Pin-like site-specific DNA recombinase
MNQVEVIIYNRVSHVSQDYTRQIKSLQATAKKKGWLVRRVFSEKISGMSKVESRTELLKAIEYAKANSISILATSELSRLGRRVLPILKLIDLLHENGIGVYIEQFNMISMEDQKENPSMTILLQTVAIMAELETSTAKNRQRQGIELAKLNGKYKGRKRKAKANPSKLLAKYADVADLVLHSDLSLRRISKITGRSINTIRKVKKITLL